MKRLLAICFICAAVTAFAEPESKAELLTVIGGNIYPTNVAATVSDVARVAAAAQLAAATALAAEQAAGLVSNAVEGVTEVINSMEGVGYIRGYVLQFGAGIMADTNMLASIVKLEAAGRAGDGDSLWNIYTYFSENPGVEPIIRYTSTLRGTNQWEQATTTGPPTIENVTVGDTIYEAYKHTVKMPPEYAGAFFRAYADIHGGSTNQVFFPVNNGVSVNGTAPLTGTFIDGENVYKFVGGIRVEAD